MKPVDPPLKYPPMPACTKRFGEGGPACTKRFGEGRPRLRRVIHRWRNPPKHQAMST
ncbi:MAG: hypothetical protein ACPL6D_16135 [Thermodesulfobacteriota bacterium]